MKVGFIDVIVSIFKYQRRIYFILKVKNENNIFVKSEGLNKSFSKILCPPNYFEKDIVGVDIFWILRKFNLTR